MSPPKPPPDDGGGGGGGAGGGGGGPAGGPTRDRTAAQLSHASVEAGPAGVSVDAACGPQAGPGPARDMSTLSAEVFASPTASGPTAAALPPPTDAGTDGGSVSPATFTIGVGAPSSRGKTGRFAFSRKTKPAPSNPSSGRASPSGLPASRSTAPADPSGPKPADAGTPPPPAARASHTEPPPNVWANARDALLGDGPTTAPPQVYDDEVRFADNYALARRMDYRIMPDGYQRAATPLEEATMLLYKQKKIFLTEPPRFIDEIYPLAVRLVLRQAHHDHMMYDLFVQTPARLKWTAQAAKYHFFESVVRLNQTTSGTSPRQPRGSKSKSSTQRGAPAPSPPARPSSTGPSKGVELFRDVFVFTVSADAHLAVLRFTRPELRQKWLNSTFKLPFGTVKLRGTSTFAQEDKRAGLDRTAVKQLYVMELLGEPNMSLYDVHAIALALSGGLPILDIKAIQPSGSRALAPHVWQIRLYCFDAPTDITNVRCVKVKQGARVFELGFHLPRTATRHPCVTCLSVEHYPSKCPHKERDEEARAPYVRVLEIPETVAVTIEPATVDMEGHRQQMLRLHEAVAPGLPLATTADSSPPHSPSAPVPGPPTPGAPEEVVASAPQPAQRSGGGRAKKGAQVRALAKAIAVNRAAASGKQQALAKTLRATRASGQRHEPRVLSPTDSAVRGPKPRPKLVRRGARPIPSPECVQVGVKRPVDAVVSTSSRSVFTEIADPEPTYEPVMRQAKRDDEHQSVDRRLPEPTRERLEWLPPGGALPPVTKQLTVTSFLTRLNAGTQPPAGSPGEPAAHTPASAGDSVQVLGTRPGPPSTTFAALLTTIKARTVRTVADGRCLYDSLRAAQSRTCGESVDATNPTERALTKDLMADLNTLLAEDLVPLLAIGSLQLRDLCSRYLEEETIAADAVPRLVAYFNDAALQDCPSVERHYWGGEAEITAFVSWTGEPVYVIDVWPDGSAFVQRYAPVDHPFPDGSTATKVVRQGPSIARFIAHIEIYRRQKVVPLMLALHHAYVKGSHSAHFSAVRIQDAEYRHFVGTKRKQEEMKERLPRVLAEISDLEQSLTPAPLDSEPSVWSSSGCSEYVPSSVSSGPSAAPPARTEDANVAAPCVDAATSTSARGAEASPVVLGKTVDVEAVTQRTLRTLGEEQPLPAFNLSQLTATPPDPSIRYDSFAPAPSRLRHQSGHLAAPDEALLLERLRSDDPLDEQHQRLLRQAQKANRTAFRTWLSRQQRTNPATHRLLVNLVDPATATAALTQRPGALSGLFRSLPFPEVLLATTTDQIIVDIGRAAIVIGRLQMFHRLRSALDGDIQTMLSTWAAAIHASTDPDVRWNLAHDEGRWQRLNMASSRCGLHLQHRSQPGLTNSDWCRLVAVLLLSPGALPHAFVTRELPSQCDALLMWLSNVTNVLDTVAAGSAVARRLWHKAGEVFERWSPTHEGRPAPSTPPSKGSGPRRN